MPTIVRELGFPITIPAVPRRTGMPSITGVIAEFYGDLAEAIAIVGGKPSGHVEARPVMAGDLAEYPSAVA